MAVRPLPAPQRDTVLAWLGVPAPSRTRAWLDALLVAYGHRVPWESASRIVRRRRHGTPAACVAAPPVFWDAAMQRGLGGTCFESNAALAALLVSVDVPCTLTINDMPPSVGVHTALIVEAEGERLVVDAGYPLYAAVPLPCGDATSEVPTRWGTFSAAPSPAGDGRYTIVQRPHPRAHAFELVDRPVPASAYETATCDDYGLGGLFLDRVVIRKIVAGDVWRFTTGDDPWVLERFRDGTRTTEPLPVDVDAAAARLARHFAIDEATVREALGHLAQSQASPSDREGRKS